MNKNARVAQGVPTWFKLLGAAILAMAVFSCLGGGPTPPTGSASTGIGSSDALYLCQSALKAASKDPEKAEVPYVTNHGSGDEFYYAWGPSTKMARMRNGLGLEVATTASCTVSRSQKRITSLTLDGKTLL